MIEPGLDGESDKINSDNETYNIDADVANIVMQGRIYDLLLVIAQKISPEDTAKMLELHSQGKLYGPPPFWDEEAYS